MPRARKGRWGAQAPGSKSKKRIEPAKRATAELENVCVERGRRRRIKTKAAGVDAIADSGVIRDVTLRFVA